MSIKETLDLIDGAISDKDFEKELERMRFFANAARANLPGCMRPG